MVFIQSASRPAKPVAWLASALVLLAACASDAGGNTDMMFGPSTSGDSSVPDAGNVLPLGDAGAAPADAALPATDSAVIKPTDATVGSDATLVASDAAADGSAGDGGGTDASAVGIGLQGSPYRPFPTTGMPLDTPEGAWKYHEFPDSFCRDGTKAGITVFKNSASKKVMFFFQGGGACFDLQTCLTNPSTVAAGDKTGPGGGILDRSNAANPVKDWNFVFLPYCTGDVFGGTRADVTVDGADGPQKFVGYLNTQAFLQRVVPTFPDATDVLVTGVSAGGFGASTSVILIQRAFPNVKVKLIDDSGPPMGSPALATCLQKTWRETWGLDQSILKDCGAACPKPDDFSFDYGIHLTKTFSNRLSGLIESAEDSIISGFYGIGNNDCTGILLLTPVSGADFQKALVTYRDTLKSSAPNFGTYFPPGSQHTWLQGDSFYTGNIGGEKLLDWVTNIINDKGTKHLGL